MAMLSIMVVADQHRRASGHGPQPSKTEMEAPEGSTGIIMRHGMRETSSRGLHHEMYITQASCHKCI